MRLDHARVVDMFRKERSLPLIKDYLLNVQKTNILEVGGDISNKGEGGGRHVSARCGQSVCMHVHVRGCLCEGYMPLNLCA